MRRTCGDCGSRFPAEAARVVVRSPDSALLICADCRPRYPAETTYQPVSVPDRSRFHPIRDRR